MKTLILSLTVVAVLVVGATALRTVSASTPAPEATPPVATPSSQPSTPPSDTPEEPAETPAPDDSDQVVGTIKIVDGVAVSGPGVSLAEALASPIAQPVLVRGALFKATDGKLFLAASVTDASEPAFGGPRLLVVGYPESAPEWDLANADLTGLQEANGILFFKDARLYGVIES